MLQAAWDLRCEMARGLFFSFTSDGLAGNERSFSSYHFASIRYSGEAGFGYGVGIEASAQRL